MKASVIFAINIYKKFLSPFLSSSCRFNPSCSRYYIEALQRYGLAKGTWLFARRIIKCHPWHPGGYDPVEGMDTSPMMSGRK